MVWLLEKGMLLKRSKKLIVRIIGSLIMIPPILKAKWIERRL